MKSTFKYLYIVTALVLLQGLVMPALSREVEPDNEFLDFDISQLMQVTITSVSKKPETLSDAAAAVFVITQDDIHRSGATSLPEVLRLAPGLQVAQFASNKWSVSSRGFGGQFSNKLLVLIDGRTVYTPAFSGVYWDVQGVVLEDVARIEVIRGPGATLWGSNAMNGVINIITRNAKEITGGFVKVGAGNRERFLGGLRYGGELNKNSHGRLYLKYNKRNSFTLYRDGRDANDDWDNLQAGFRLDGAVNGKNTWTLQGDVYTNDEHQLISPIWLPTPPFIMEVRDNFTAEGGNILGRWNKQYSDSSELMLQLYYDYTERKEVYIDQSHATFDIEAQLTSLIGKNNNLTMGVGYRTIDAEFDSTFQVSISDENRTDHIFSGFLQDAITLIPDELTLTLGSKWEHNDYTGHEFQPSGRLLWKPAPTHALWAAVSRAVRTPSQLESDGTVILAVDPTLPPFPATRRLIGDGRFESEELIAYEAGYRWFPQSTLSFDLSLFYNDHDSLLSTELDTPFARNTLFFDNKSNAKSHGFELVIDWQASSWADLQLSYSYMDLDAKNDPDSLDYTMVSTYEGSFPKHQLSLNTNLELSEQWRLNIWLRYFGEIKEASNVANALQLEIDDYVDCDLTLSYRPTKQLEFMLVGQNLFNSERLEFISEFFNPPIEVERGIFATVTWTFD